MRTELGNRMIGQGTNSLASSIILVCRARSADAPVATRREYLAALRSELPQALRLLQTGNVAPVDLAQAAIGPRHGGIHPLRAAARHVVFVAGTGGQTRGVITCIVIWRFFLIPLKGRKNHAGTTPTALRRDAHSPKPLIGYTKRSRSTPASVVTGPSDASRLAPVPRASYRYGRKRTSRCGAKVRRVPVSVSDVQATDSTAPDARRGPP